MNEGAVKAYRKAIHAAAAEIDRIHEHVVEDMMGIDPESVNYSHVGDAMRLYANLEAISKWMGIGD